jgi:N-acetylmuramoyl-L-alanine amidase
MFHRTQVEPERRQHQAILRAVYEANLRLQEPGYYRPTAKRQRRGRGIRAAVAITALLIGAAGPLYRLALNVPTKSSTLAYSQPDLQRVASDATPMSGTNNAGREFSDAGITNSAASPQTVASDGLVDRLREGHSTIVDDAQPTVRELFGLLVHTITIDAGHGGRDPGAIGKAGTREKDVTLDIARRLKEKLASNPQYRIVLVRDSDTFVPLKERAAYANSLETDLFISIHVNYLTGISKNAVETYYFGKYEDPATRKLAQRENEHSLYTISEFGQLMKDMQDSMKLQESKGLAQTIQGSLLRNMRLQNQVVLDTGVRAAPFVVLLGVKAPSVLVEIGSLSSTEAESSLGEARYKDEIASYLAAGISDYLANRPQRTDTHHVKSENGKR